jgi:hypothetical protein
MREKLIRHGYPKQMVNSWSEEYCAEEWNELKSFLKDHKIYL